MDTRYNIDKAIIDIKEEISTASAVELLEIKKRLKVVKKDIHSMVIRIDKVLSTNNYKKVEVRKTVNKISTLLGHTYKEILSKKSSSHKLSDAKKITYQLLYFELGLSIRFIASNIFGYKYHNVVGKSIRDFKSLDSKLKADREHLEKYEYLKSQIK
jgi:hypothetical protein